MDIINKTVLVIERCETREQVEAATKYAVLAVRRLHSNGSHVESGALLFARYIESISNIINAGVRDGGA